MERQQQCDSDVHSIFWAQHWYITAKDENADGFRSIQDVAIPQPIPRYNAYMGGVDKSDQFISYNRVLRKTKWYWKTMFYHLLYIITTNSSIIHCWLRIFEIVYCYGLFRLLQWII